MLSFDERVFVYLNEALSGQASAWLLRLVSSLGNGFVLAILVIPVMARFDWKAWRMRVIPMVLSVATTGVIVTAAKVLVGRERPPVWAALRGVDVRVPFGMPADKSFPSGHAQTAFGVAVYLSLLYPSRSVVFLALAVLVGISRIGLGVHYPSDVVVGAFIGSTGSIVAFFIAKRRRQSSRCQG